MGMAQRRGLFGAVAQAPPGISPWGASSPASGGGVTGQGSGETALHPEGVRLQNPALTLSGRALAPGCLVGALWGCRRRP